jgi:methionyl-tRNA formyltransferase
MKKISEKIVFFGSGPVAAHSLELLLNDFEVEAIVTKPAKTRKKDPVPVMDLANQVGIKTYLPTNKLELDELIQQNPFTSNLAILIDYGIIVTQTVIDYFPLGIINSHFSLLPKWRGPDPITFSILSGDHESGVSLMLITAGMDEGPLLKQELLKISTDMNTQSLTDVLVELSNQLLKSTVPSYISKDIEPFSQPSNIMPTYSRKLTKLDGQIDWTKTAHQIEREIRAYIEWPKSYTKIKDKDIIITKASVRPAKGTPGNYRVDDSLLFYCGKGGLNIDRLKPAGKNEMSIQSFLAGYRSIL